MRQFSFLCAVILVLAVALPGAAGDKHKCTASADECLNKMVQKIQSKGWLGVETEEAGKGRWQITAVYPDSPAERAGFKAGDVFLAINGVEMSDDNKDALKKVKHSLGPGSEVRYVVKRQGGKVTLDARLGSVPDAVMAEWVGEHMVNNHAKVKMASK
jgi:C-terminal processing protease CtpA/Prc